MMYINISLEKQNAVEIILQIDGNSWAYSSNQCQIITMQSPEKFAPVTPTVLLWHVQLMVRNEITIKHVFRQIWIAR